MVNTAAYMRAYRAKNKDKVRQWEKNRRERDKGDRAERQQVRHYKKSYGLPPAECRLMKARGCDICGRHRQVMCIDHCHETGKVRGVLCNKCNTALGFLDEDVVLMQKMIAYTISKCQPLKVLLAKVNG